MVENSNCSDFFLLTYKANNLFFFYKLGDFYNNKAKLKSKNEISCISQMAMETLTKQPLKWQNVEIEMSFTKAPALKATYTLYGIRCNLVFGASTSVATTRFIESVLDKQKMCK